MVLANIKMILEIILIMLEIVVLVIKYFLKPNNKKTIALCARNSDVVLIFLTN